MAAATKKAMPAASAVDRTSTFWTCSSTNRSAAGIAAISAIRTVPFSGSWFPSAFLTSDSAVFFRPGPKVPPLLFGLSAVPVFRLLFFSETSFFPNPGNFNPPDSLSAAPPRPGPACFEGRPVPPAPRKSFLSIFRGRPFFALRLPAAGPAALSLFSLPAKRLLPPAFLEDTDPPSAASIYGSLPSVYGSLPSVYGSLPSE